MNDKPLLTIHALLRKYTNWWTKKNNVLECHAYNLNIIHVINHQRKKIHILWFWSLWEILAFSMQVILQKKKHLVTCISPSPFSHSNSVIIFMGYNTDYEFSLRSQTGSFSSCISGLPESVCCYYLVSVAIRKSPPNLFIFAKGLLWALISFFFSLCCSVQRDCEMKEMYSISTTETRRAFSAGLEERMTLSWSELTASLGDKTQLWVHFRAGVSNSRSLGTTSTSQLPFKGQM